MTMSNHEVLFAMQQQGVNLNNRILQRHTSNYFMQRYHGCYDNEKSHQCDNDTSWATMYFAGPVEVTNWPKIVYNHDLNRFAI